MVVVKWSDKVEGYGDSIDAPLCGGLYKEQEDYLVTWSVTDPYAKINCFTCSKEDNYWTVLGYQYNEQLKNWRGPIQNGELCLQTLKEKKNIEDTCSKYAGSANCNDIPRELNP